MEEKNRIYLDYAATTPIHPQVLEAMNDSYRSLFGNPSSLHQSGRLARQAVESARNRIAQVLFAKSSDEIIFTGSGSESDNLAIIGTALANQEKGNHIITSNIEHHAVLHACEFLELAEEDFDRVIRVNLKGVFLTGQAAARQMAAQGRGGTIINMSSVNAVMAIPASTPYVVAKGGVNQLTKVMALALVDKGIRVNAIGPGSIMTEVFKSVATGQAAMNKILSRTPMGRVGEPDEIASVALFLASEDSSYITGQTIYPDGGRLALNYTVPVAE